MNWRIKIVLWVLLGFALGVAQTLWERGTDASTPQPVHHIPPGATLV
jgi:hypothetical protein